jgi:hypothetical protein
MGWFARIFKKAARGLYVADRLADGKRFLWETHANAHGLLVGRSRSGKTNAMAVHAKALRKAEPGAYIIYCSTKSLAPFSWVADLTLDPVEEPDRFLREMASLHALIKQRQMSAEKPVIYVYLDEALDYLTSGDKGHKANVDVVLKILTKGAESRVFCILGTQTATVSALALPIHNIGYILLAAGVSPTFASANQLGSPPTDLKSGEFYVGRAMESADEGKTIRFHLIGSVKK